MMNMSKPPKYSAKINRKNTFYLESTTKELQDDHLLPEDIIKHIYPSHINPVSSQVAKDLINYLLKPENFQGIPRKKLIKHLTEEKDHSRSTIQNKVIPMLKRRGLIKKTRDKGIHPTIDFSNMLKDIANCWETIYKRQRKLSKRKS